MCHIGALYLRSRLYVDMHLVSCISGGDFCMHTEAGFLRVASLARSRLFQLPRSDFRPTIISGWRVIG